ncbi:MAG: hypothetical protein JWQ54_3954 [Mucilaginibacter sp.]|nr:hypothetical protein [Mucilaginibacter sp.]
MIGFIIKKDSSGYNFRLFFFRNIIYQRVPVWQRAVKTQPSRE